jgi:hypothetical protein
MMFCPERMLARYSEEIKIVKKNQHDPTDSGCGRLGFSAGGGWTTNRENRVRSTGSRQQRGGESSAQSAYECVAQIPDPGLL